MSKGATVHAAILCQERSGLASSGNVRTATYHGYGKTVADAISDAKDLIRAHKATPIGKPKITFDVGGK